MSPVINQQKWYKYLSLTLYIHLMKLLLLLYRDLIIDLYLPLKLLLAIY